MRENRIEQIQSSDRIRQQAALGRISRQAISETVLQKFLTASLGDTSLALEAEYCQILQYLPVENEFLLVAHANDLPIRDRITIPADDNILPGYVIKGNEECMHTSFERNSKIKCPNLPGLYGVRSGMSAAITVQGVKYGVVEAYRTEAEAFNSDDRLFLNIVANIVAASIERFLVVEELHRINEALEEQVAERSGLVHLNRELMIVANEASSIPEMMQSVLTSICLHTGWPLGHVFTMAKTENERLQSTPWWFVRDTERYRAFIERTEGIDYKLGFGLPGQVYAKGKPIWVTDSAVEELPRADVFRECGIISGFAFPIKVGNEVIAVMELFTDTMSEPNQLLLDSLAMMGVQLGIMVERLSNLDVLRTSEQKLLQAQRVARIGSWEWDKATNQMTWSKALFEIYGIDPLVFPGKFETFFELDHPDDRENTRRTIESALKNPGEFEYDHRIVRPDGQVRHLRGRGTVITDDAGLPVKVIGTSQNITARKKMEEELAEIQRRLVDSTEKERLQLAQEIHDEPLQDLYGLIYQISSMRDEVTEDEKRLEFDAVEQELNHVINILRAICGELRPPTLAPFGLEGAIRDHADRFQQKNPSVKITLDLMYDGQTLPDRLRLALFRIYQQALSNVLRHAHASEVVIRFRYNETHAELEIEDNGSGFNMPSRWVELVREGHYGLAGAAERVELINGHLVVNSTPGQGTRVWVIAPIISH